MNNFLPREASLYSIRTAIAAQPLEDLVTLGFRASLPGSSWIQYKKAHCFGELF